MDDLISRQAAIDAVCEHGTDLERRGITVLSVANHKQATVDLLESLLSVQERKGRWERHYTRPNVYADLLWHCSVCGYKNENSFANVYHKFCPNCGARMEGADDAGRDE